MASDEIEFKIVAHVISESSAGIQARLVLRDPQGFNRAVLAVGSTCRGFDSAVEDVVREWEKSLPWMERVS